MTEAQTRAGPLYDAAYVRPGAEDFVAKIQPLLNRPAMKGAMKNAYRIAEEEGRDPANLGLVKDAFDNVVLTPPRQSPILDAAGKQVSVPGDPMTKAVPTWQTLDYVKRGMDDVVEAYRDPTSGRLNLNTEGKAVNNTLRTFIKAFDTANPDYGAARAAYAGPVKGVTALNLGRKALNMTADDLEERMRGMTDFERQLFALGTRRAMAELVDSKGDTANIVNAVAGAGKKRAMLARLFGDRKEFQRFVDTLAIEQEAFQTYKRARAGSPTAANVADDSSLAVATGVGDIALSGLPIMSALRVAARSRNASLAEKAKGQIAEMLGETNPAKVREIIIRYKRAEAQLARNPRVPFAAAPGDIPDDASRASRVSNAVARAANRLDVAPFSGAAVAPVLTGQVPSLDPR